MRLLRTLSVVVLVALVLTLGAAPGEAKDEKNFVQKVLEWVEVGDPIVTDKITLYPLVIPRALPDVGVVAATDADVVEFTEPDFPRRRYDLGVKNEGDKPVLVIGGTILEGGKRDRLVRQSSIVAPASEAELRTLPASTSSERRKVAVPFNVADSLAPLYLRQQAEFGGSVGTVTGFIARWLDFRMEGDERKSLVAIATSEKLKAFCLPCHQAASRFPKTEGKGPRVIGGVGVIRGRIQGLFLYGNNALVRECFPMMLKGATYPAAAIELRAQKAGIPLPASNEDPAVTQAKVLKDVNDLLNNLRKATYRKDRLEEGVIGEALLVKTSNSTRGRAIGLNGNLVQFVVFPYDPFKNALYGTAIDVPNPEEMEDPERPGGAEVRRRAAMPGRRLTEYEKRLLERLRPNRGGFPGGNPKGGAGRGAGGGGKLR